MPQPEMKADDVFHVIGFTHEDVQTGAHMALMQRVLPPAVRPAPVTKLVEVYFCDRFGAGVEDCTERYGDKYLSVYFYNESAIALSNHHRIKLPATIGKITRAELPRGFGASIRMPLYAPA